MGAEMMARSESLRQKIYTIRGEPVMIDSDLAEIYAVETRVFNQAVKRNIERFPPEFRFQLTQEEFDANLRSQIVISSGHGGRRYLPYAFTEQGVAMLATVLRSATAVKVSIQIMKAFIAMRRLLAASTPLLDRLDTLEKRQITHEIRTDDRFEQIFSALEAGNTQPAQGIFFDGQIFDAYVFVNDLLRSAKLSIVLIDNYIDDTVLLQLSKRPENVSAAILTKSITPKLKQDLAKHNNQYPPISIKAFPHSHDRFLILDGETVYHLGASLKDLGKRWFAFSRMEKGSLAIMARLKEVLK